RRPRIPPCIDLPNDHLPRKRSSMSISKQEFARRRKTLMEHMEADSIAILPSAELQLRNRDADFPFRQDSDFFYLSGFNEPSAVLVLLPGRQHGETILFCRERNKEKEI